MADITRRTQRKVADYLEDGERIEVAVLCEPRGTYGIGMLKTAVAPRVGQAPMNRVQERQKNGQMGLVEKFPSEPCVIAVSARRVFAFPSNGLRFKDPTMVIQRCDVTVGEVYRRGLGKVMQLVFNDGSAIEVDTQIGQPIGKLIEGLGNVAPVR